MGVCTCYVPSLIRKLEKPQRTAGDRAKVHLIYYYFFRCLEMADYSGFSKVHRSLDRWCDIARLTFWDTTSIDVVIDGAPGKL